MAAPAQPLHPRRKERDRPAADRVCISEPRRVPRRVPRRAALGVPQPLSRGNRRRGGRAARRALDSEAQERLGREAEVSATGGGLIIAARFPFGRYAATPWFRSRREHVGNVEWPPSPWRIARALLCTAHRLGDDVDAVVALVRRFAVVEPRYLLPPAGEVVYAQWMPQLEFDDHPLAGDRSENGHTLLDLDPDAELVVAWPGVQLHEPERDRLRRLLSATPFLGQSVSICELELRDALSAERSAHDGVAVPRSAEDEIANVQGERSVVRLLAPEPSVTREQLEVTTADGIVKAMPAPPGSRWVEYVRVIPRRPRPQPSEPFVAKVIHRLEGALRPPVEGPSHPEAGRPGRRGKVKPEKEKEVKLEELVYYATRFRVDADELALADDDLDGRAERLVITFDPPRPRPELRSLLAPVRRLTGPAIDCALRLESVVWAAQGGARAPSGRDEREHLLVFRLQSERPPLLADAIVVCEAFRRRLLGVAGRRLGADAIPVKLSGKRPNGDDARDDHSHIHVLAASAEGHVVDCLAVFCPAGLSRDEVILVRSVTLPALLGSAIRLLPTRDQRFSRPARLFRSHTPFLPVRHPKRRGGALRDTPAEQVAEELRRRGLPEPLAVRPLDGPWASFRTLRRAKQGAFPYLGAHGFELEFHEPVQGPIALGRNSHFGMGLFLPVS
ncbi:MAG: type I-U CRISPR-associated protein Cas5/Cas6 [Rhodospirillales bacterium]|nr:type I-U CRISPR-associated protein Cas5/Cas6 [Rhodospirillales bacterium]